MNIFYHTKTTAAFGDSRLFSGFGWNDMHKLALFEHAREIARHARGELHGTLNTRVDCVISTHFDVLSGVDFRSALSHENLSRANRLPVGTLDTQPLRFRIVDVLGGPARLFMCHRGSFLGIIKRRSAKGTFRFGEWDYIAGPRECQ